MKQTTKETKKSSFMMQKTYTKSTRSLHLTSIFPSLFCLKLAGVHELWSGTEFRA